MLTLAHFRDAEPELKGIGHAQLLLKDVRRTVPRLADLLQRLADALDALPETADVHTLLAEIHLHIGEGVAALARTEALLAAAWREDVPFLFPSPSPDTGADAHAPTLGVAARDARNRDSIANSHSPCPPHSCHFSRSPIPTPPSSSPPSPASPAPTSGS